MGKDGFHSVPNFLKQEWDGVESVLTRAFLGPIQERLLAVLAGD